MISLWWVRGREVGVPTVLGNINGIKKVPLKVPVTEGRSTRNRVKNAS